MEVVRKIMAILPPHPNNGNDVPLWPGDHLGSFSVASAYQIIQGFFEKVRISIWKLMWKLQVPERIRCFAWQINHGRLMANQWKFRRGLADPYCSHCSSSVESILHVLRDCPIAAQVWSHLVRIDHKPNFFQSDLAQWIALNLNSNSGRCLDLEWSAVWIIVCCMLWIWRNKQARDAKFSRLGRPWILIEQQARNHVEGRKVSMSGSNCFPSEVRINWLSPSNGWVALNTDEAVKNDLGLAGCGGLIRDQNGDWVCGFSKFMGSCSIYTVEL